MAIRHRWTPADYSLLREMTGRGERTSVIAAAIGTTVNAVNLKRQRHGIARPEFTDMERFQQNFRVEGNGCWVWTAATGGGYGFFCPTPARGTRWKGARAHRWLWEQINGPVPAGLELDHLCHNRSCVNPRHLEAVSHQENCRRGLAGAHLKAKTHCPKGHEYAGDNLVRRNGRRHCRACERARTSGSKGRLAA